MTKQCFLGLIACASSLLVSHGVELEINNEMVFPGSIKPLVSHGDPLIFWNVPTSWWHIPRDYVAVEEGIIRIFTTPKMERVVFNYREMPRGPESRYRLIAEVDWNGKGEASAHVNALERRGLFLRSAPRERLKEVGNQKVELLLELPHEINGVRPEWVSFGFNVSGDGAELTIRSVSFKPVPDPTKSGLGRVVVDGKVCDSIVVSLDGRDKGFFDKRAARVLRQYIYRMCGELLPIRLYKDGVTATGGKILVGRAAVESGAIPSRKFDSLKQDGYILSVGSGTAMLAGKDSGSISAAWDLLGRLGIRYYSREDVVIPAIAKVELKPIEVKRNPFFGIRLFQSPWWFYEDQTPFGHTDSDIMAHASKATFSCQDDHTANGLVDYRLYSEKHPEYFSLGEDGKRLRVKEGYWRFDVHLCTSNPDVQKIAAENAAVWMRLQPWAKIFPITPGDGTAGFCQCENCLAWDLTAGDYAERMWHFTRLIADHTKKKFPERKLYSISYTQRLESVPVMTKMTDRMLTKVCIYPRNWDCQSHFICNHNRVGLEKLKEWTDKYPEKTMYTLYPRAREEYSLYAVLYAHVDTIRHAASHQAPGIFFCWVPKSSFAPLYSNVISELLWDPNIDVEQSIDRFMAEYFGPAAPGMRRFFNLLYDEIKNRPFHQNIEDLNPGLVTAGFAKKSYECFADSEKAVADQPKYLARVLREKMFLLWNDLNDRNLGNGQVDSAELYPRLAEFVDLARKAKDSRFARHQAPSQWFWSVGQIEVKAQPWYEDKALGSLLADPAEFAESRRVIIQEDITGGWRLPLRGFAGGTAVRPYSYLCEPRQETSGVRRPAVGRDSRMWCVFKIDKVPEGEYVIEIEGQDDEKEGRALFSIVINGTTVFSGENAFAERGWSKVSYRIPEGVLKKGENRLDFINITPEKDAHLQKTDVDETIGRRVDPFWGWVLFSDIIIVKANQYPTSNQ